ncbi:MAG: amino acid ABC transporter permease [Oscillospiraceae bacterium]
MERGFWGWIVFLLQQYGPQYAKGTLVTILLAVVGTLAGLAIGLAVGIVRTIPLRRGGQTHETPRSIVLRCVNAVLAVYIEVFRGTPMMVQAMLIFYGLTEFAGLSIEKMPAAFLIITLNTGAYMSEIVRGGIQAVDDGQSEAAKSVGMTHWQAMLSVVLPQAIRNILPATGNEFVVNLKDSSVLSVIMVGELFYATSVTRAVYYRTYEPFFIAAVIYLTLTFVSSRLLRLLENRMDGPKNYTLIASSTTLSMPMVKRRK